MEYVNGTRPNILIVDDIEANTAILEMMIESLGYKARTALSAKRAMELIEEELPEIILSDISMPDIDGFQLCEVLKKDVRTKDIPLIFISAMDATEEKVKGLRLGAVDFISKPFSLEEVTIRVNTHLKIYRMQKEMESYNFKLNTIVNEQRKRIVENQKNILYGLASMTEGKEIAKSGNHLEVISNNAHFLAQSLTFSPDFEGQISNSFIESIGIAALLHDIGKIMMPDRFRYNRDSLNAEEMEQLKQHSEKGAVILERIQSYCEDNEFLAMAIDIARYHHERYDGSGYPKGLKGNEIPLAARIVRIVCSYDKLTSERVYKAAFSQEQAVKMMMEKSGKKFDPAIMKVFEKVVKQFMHAEVTPNDNG